MKTKPVAYATLGRTTAGKKTLAKFLSKSLNLTYIPEAEIKRRMVENYSVLDSLREDLRDISYKEAAKIASIILSAGNDTLVDAAFHKDFRRKWLYDEASKFCSSLFLFYCKCNNIEKVKERLALRKEMPKNAESQADSIEIYEFINNNFDEPLITLINLSIPVCLFHIDSDHNRIEKIEIINSTNEFKKLVGRHKKIILNHLNAFQTNDNSN